MHRVEAHVEADGGLVAEHPPGKLVVLGLTQDQRRGRMAVLMSRDPDTYPLLDNVRDLVAKSVEPLVPSALAGKEPGTVGAAQEGRPVVVHILRDQLREA